MKRAIKITVIVVICLFAVHCIDSLLSCYSLDKSQLDIFAKLGGAILNIGVIALVIYVSELQKKVSENKKWLKSKYIIELDKAVSPLVDTLGGDSPYSKYTDYMLDFGVSEDLFKRFAVSAIDDAIRAKYAEYYESDEYKELCRKQREQDRAFYEHMAYLEAMEQNECEE